MMEKSQWLKYQNILSRWVALQQFRVSHEVLGKQRFEVRSSAQKLIQFNRIDLRFSGCGKTLKENCLLCVLDGFPALIVSINCPHTSSQIEYESVVRIIVSPDVFIYRFLWFPLKFWFAEPTFFCTSTSNSKVENTTFAFRLRFGTCSRLFNRLNSQIKWHVRHVQIK